MPRFRRGARSIEPDDGPAAPRAWRESGVGDEVEAFLAGRLVDHLVAAGEPVPMWAVLNRLAHGDRSDLARFVTGAHPSRIAHPSSGQRSWASAELFIAGQLLVRAPTPDELRRLQRATLVPLELELIARARVERLTANQVLELGAEAVDSFHADR